MARGHLGDRLAALVDGQLDHVERDRVLAHLTRCAACRAEAAEQRAVKARLDRVVVRPPGSLEGRLLALAPTDPRALHRDVAREPGWVSGWARPGAAQPPASPAGPVAAGPVPAGPLAAVGLPARPAALGRRGPLRRAPLSVTAGLLAVGAGLVGLGGEPAELPQRDPGLPGLVVEHASTTTRMPLVDAGAVGVTWGSATAGRVTAGPAATAPAAPGWGAVPTATGGPVVTSAD